MELNFLGRGSAFNFKEGNTSAYFIENNELFLIDCGESTFKSIMENNILNNINKIHIIITHTHSDHVGSLGSLLTYTYFTLKQQVKIIVKNDKKYMSTIEMILKAFGCPTEAYTYVNEEEYAKRFDSFESIKLIETTHSKELYCNSIIFETKQGVIYYSGDSKDDKIIKSLIEENNIDKLYVDVTTDEYSANVHMHIDKLNEIIPSSIRKKVYCMHFNNDECINKAYKYGFNIVNNLVVK